MATEARPHRRQGFTLVEVVMSMVLLGIGLMMMVPLTISAIRTVGLAERNSRAAALATQYLEEALLDLRQNRLPGQLDCTLANGDKLVRTINVTNPNLPVVTVTVTPSRRASTPQPLTVRSSVFTPTAIIGTVTNASCPV